jgi:hypothetical protein
MQRRSTWAIAGPCQHPPVTLFACYIVHYADGSEA